MLSHLFNLFFFSACYMCSSDLCQYGTVLGPHGMINVTFCLTYPCITTSLRKTEWLMYIVLVPCKGICVTREQFCQVLHWQFNSSTDMVSSLSSQCPSLPLIIVKLSNLQKYSSNPWAYLLLLFRTLISNSYSLFCLLCGWFITAIDVTVPVNGLWGMF